MLTSSCSTNRNWRYHKELKQWLTKDTNFEPVRISHTEERGFYIFFDPIGWQRQRVSVSGPLSTFRSPPCSENSSCSTNIWTHDR